MCRLSDELRGRRSRPVVAALPEASIVMTVRNDTVGTALTLGSLMRQTHPPKEIIVVDGGSDDGTLGVIRQYQHGPVPLRLIEAPNANIARGRNIGTAAATTDIIATTDAGCIADSRWLERLVTPFAEDRETDFVAGTYRIEPKSLLEHVVGLATMRGQLEPIDPKRFNPSARSMAYRKTLWERAGGWPDWVRYSEDTLFDHKIRRLNARWQVAEEAIVAWRPRESLRGIARQFYFYGTGRGHTQIEKESFLWNLRNMALVTVAAMLCLVSPWLFPLPVGLALYFFGVTHHDRAWRITVRTNRIGAYPLTMLVMNVVQFAHTTGYVIGSYQRWRDSARYRGRTEAYLTVS